MAETGRERACPCCAGKQDGEHRDLCDRCMTAALAGVYPHGCRRASQTCGEEFLSSDTQGRPFTLICELPVGHPGDCDVAPAVPDA